MVYGKSCGFLGPVAGWNNSSIVGLTTGVHFQCDALHWTQAQAFMLYSFSRGARGYNKQQQYPHTKSRYMYLTVAFIYPCISRISRITHINP